MQRVGRGQDRRSEHYAGGEEEEEGRTRQCPRPCSLTLLPPLGIVPSIKGLSPSVQPFRGTVLQKARPSPLFKLTS